VNLCEGVALFEGRFQFRPLQLQVDQMLDLCYLEKGRYTLVLGFAQFNAFQVQLSCPLILDSLLSSCPCPF